jgi:hypothetical protein
MHSSIIHKIFFMKQVKTTLLGLSAVLALTALSSCQKIIDKIFHGHGNEEKACVITKVKQDLFGEAMRTGIVYNNNHGSPDSVIFDEAGGTAGLFYFKYDNMHRLVEYSGWYDRSEGNYLFIHYYTYAGDKIIRDSALWREAGTWTRIASLEYDAQGRVIKETGIDTLLDGAPGTSSPFDPIMYQYDGQGNLVTTLTNAYDDKVSFLRTNKVWMFTQRNYSKNNPAVATHYNEHDLPLTFADDHGLFFLQFGTPLEIEYDCSGK